MTINRQQQEIEMRVGVISDTHGLLRPEAIVALTNSDLILHAGDIGKPEVLQALQAIAPTIAVRGNNDQGAWAATLPDTPDTNLVVKSDGSIVLDSIENLAIEDVRVEFGRLAKQLRWSLEHAKDFIQQHLGKTLQALVEDDWILLVYQMRNLTSLS